MAGNFAATGALLLLLLSLARSQRYNLVGEVERSVENLLNQPQRAWPAQLNFPLEDYLQGLKRGPEADPGANPGENLGEELPGLRADAAQPAPARGLSPEERQQLGRLFQTRKWVTLNHLTDTSKYPIQAVTTSKTVKGPGNFKLSGGVEAVFTSPGYPGKYTNRIWTSWSFTGEGQLEMRCDNDLMKLGSRAYLYVTLPGMAKKPFSRFKRPGVLEATGSIKVEFLVGRIKGGNFKCSVKTAGAATAGPEPTEPEPTEPEPTEPEPTEPEPAEPEPAEPGSTGSSVGDAPVGVNDALCGISNYEQRVVGGENAPPHSYPWMCSMDFGYGPACGCSIISESYILTAAHCVGNRPKKIIVRKHKFEADPSNDLEFYPQRVTVHPDYDKRTTNNDLALIKLRGKAPLRKYIRNGDGKVRPICIPTEKCSGGSGAGCFIGREATMAGWGLLQQNSNVRPDVLQHVTVPVYDQQLCDNSYNNGKPGRITDQMICAGVAKGGRDTCQGDSGGPMMVQETVGGRTVYSLSGIVSFGAGCAQPNYPGVYTRVSEFADWIKQEAQKSYPRAEEAQK